MRWGKIGSVVSAAWLVSLALAGGAAAQAEDQTPWLGVTTQDITSELRDGLNYQGKGVIVNRVVSNSPAERAGIRKGDVIATFGSRTIDSPSDLVDLVRDARVGESVSLGIVRNGTRRTLSARLAEWPDNLEDDSEMEFPDPPVAPRAPRAPRSPRTPSAPRVFEYDGDEWNGWNGDDFKGLTMFGNRARLGVQVQDLNPSLGDALGVPDGKGVLVTDVIDDTPAQRAGIRGGDVIVRVGNDAVEETGDIRKALQGEEGNVSVTLVRKGARRTVQADIGREKTPAGGVYRMVPGNRRSIVRTPDVRRRVDSDSDMDQQMKELREELRELRRKLDAMDKD